MSANRRRSANRLRSNQQRNRRVQLLNKKKEDKSVIKLKES
jgi:hypothetical protein